MLAYARFSLFRTRLRNFHLAVVLLGLIFVQVLPAQELSRKVIAKTAPTYPELAKKMHLTGKVKLEVVVSSKGAVTAAKLVGGNPVFEQSAIDAIKQWRFEPAEKESKGIVLMEFNNQ